MGRRGDYYEMQEVETKLKDRAVAIKRAKTPQSRLIELEAP